MQTICKTCYKQFRHKPSAKRQYCSMPCYRLSRKGKFTKPPNLICKECGRALRVHPWSIKYRGKKYCSKVCYSKNQPSPMQGKKHSKEALLKMSKVVRPKGELASNWRGGITPIDKVQRIVFRNTMQRLIFERDNYTCQLCGAKNVFLQVDHIQSWADYVELRFNMKNCRTLCQKCHYKITYGKDMPENIKSWGQNLYKLERVGVVK